MDRNARKREKKKKENGQKVGLYHVWTVTDQSERETKRNREGMTEKRKRETESLGQREKKSERSEREKRGEKRAVRPVRV